MQSSESRALWCSLRPVQQGLSPLGAALWKAKKYTLFDLRFGSLGNCPGTLFTAHKTCLPHGKGNLFFKQKLLTLPLWKPSSCLLFRTVSGAGPGDKRSRGFRAWKQ